MGSELYADPVAFADDMAKMVNNEELSDLKFIIGEERHMVHAHKSILAARCEVFRAMFSERSASDDMPFVISNVHPMTFVTMLEFIYTNRCQPSLDYVVDLLAMAVEYGLSELIKLCVQFMTSNLTTDNACEFIQAALAYHLADLQRSCLQFIESHTETVFQTRGFNEMSEETLIHVLQSDGLQLDEGEILKAVKDWASVNSVVTGEPFSDICKNVVEHVRFPLLDTEELSVIEKENDKKHYIPVRLIAAAWRFHALKQIDKSSAQTRLRAGTLRRPSLQPLGHA